jgi:hypothetical protein
MRRRTIRRGNCAWRIPNSIILPLFPERLRRRAPKRTPPGESWRAISRCYNREGPERAYPGAMSNARIP